MLVFTGIYERTIDGKQRIAIPADIRGMLTEEHVRSAGPSSDSQSDSKPSIHLYISLGEGKALCIYTQAVFNKRAEELDYSID